MSPLNGTLAAVVGTYLIMTVVVCPLNTCSRHGDPNGHLAGEDAGADVSTSDAGEPAGDAAGADVATDGGVVEDGASDAGVSHDGGECGEGETFVEDACVQCGPAGGCADRRPRCVATCGELDDCSEDTREVPTMCHRGVCRNVCA